MDPSLFIAGRLRFKGNIATICVAISFLVMIVSLAVSAGFRLEIREGLSDISGDVLISSQDMDLLDEETPVNMDASYLSYVAELPAVEKIVPIAARAGILRKDADMYGVVVKGLPDPEWGDSVSLGVSVPAHLAAAADLKKGDRMLTYFVGRKVKVRQFNVVDIHDDAVAVDNAAVVYASLSDMQRLNGWEDSQVSAFEVYLHRDKADEETIESTADEIGFLLNAYSSEEDEPVVSTSSVSRYPQLFSWLSLIDFNVLIILILMTVVAGFNMISGLLIMLFENISTIGLLKSLGMRNWAIAKVFLTSSASVVGRGMAIGNALALILCAIQNTTHVLKLNPENYYVSYVPVNIDFGSLLAIDAVSFIIIMILLLIPCAFISRVDPAQTIKVR